MALLQAEDKEDKTLGGIILTLCDGSSYDPIFKDAGAVKSKQQLQGYPFFGTC